MTITDPVEQWTLDDFIEDLRFAAENGSYYEIAPEYVRLFLKQVEQRSATAVNAVELRADLAAALAHRACCGTEHDVSQGKLHGYCIVCGIPWPCDTAQYFLRKIQS